MALSPSGRQAGELLTVLIESHIARLLPSTHGSKDGDDDETAFAEAQDLISSCRRDIRSHHPTSSAIYLVLRLMDRMAKHPSLRNALQKAHAEALMTPHMEEPLTSRHTPSDLSWLCSERSWRAIHTVVDEVWSFATADKVGMAACVPAGS